MNSQKQMSNILGDTDSRNSRNTQPIVTQEQEIPISIQQQLLNNWIPVLPSTFHGALISNCTFNINVYNNNKSPPSKRRRVIVEDDSLSTAILIATAHPLVKCYNMFVHEIK